MEEFDGCVFYDSYDRTYRGSGRPVKIKTTHGTGETCIVVNEIKQTILSWEVDRVSHEPVWPAANLLCCFLASDAGVSVCTGMRVLEVGAGVGLTGLVASHFASYVCMTDGDEEHLPLLRRNARENTPKCENRPMKCAHDGCTECYEHICHGSTADGNFVAASGTIDVRHLWWGAESAKAADARGEGGLKKHTFDVVIGSDIVYLREGVNALAETIDFFLRTDKPDASAYIMNVAHHMTNLDMLVEACDRLSLTVDLVPLDSFVPNDIHREFPNAYMAHVKRLR